MTQVMRQMTFTRWQAVRFCAIVAVGLTTLAPRTLDVDPHRLPSALPMPDPVGIVFHHSETAAAYHGIRIDATKLDEIHYRDHQWGVEFQGKVYHIGYHYVILPDGQWQQGRPDHCPGAHARGHNNWLGICLIGNFDTRSPRYGEWPRRPTRAQILATIQLCKKLIAQYKIPPERIRRHRDVGDTLCPGNRFPHRFLLRELARYAKEQQHVASTARRSNLVQ
jgi:hypothetical protein